jgi:hypothetical protein
MPTSTQSRPRAGMAFSRPAAMPSQRSSAGALLDGLQDSLTFGLGDHVKAAFGTAADALHGQSVVDAYRRRIAAQHAYDRADARAHGTARGIGKGIGTIAQVAASGPLSAAIRGGGRIAEVTPIALRELGVLGAAGAGGGIAAQAGVNKVTGRHSSLGDYIASGVAGTVEALMSRSGMAAQAGAAGGATASVVGDILNGRMPSRDRAITAASQGAFLGAAAGTVGRKLSNALPSRAKGNLVSKEGLGEVGSVLRSIARGDLTISRAKRAAHLPGGGWTFPDQRTLRRKLIESKFGWTARLSDRQTQAYHELGDKYRVDHFLPDDVGSLFALPTVQTGHHWNQAAQDNQRLRR